MDKQQIDEIVASANLEVNPTKERLEAIVRLSVPMIATVCAMFGFSIDPLLWTNFALAGIGVFSIVWAWWKGNHMTVAAMIGGEVTDAIKAEQRIENAEAKDIEVGGTD